MSEEDYVDIGREPDEYIEDNEPDYPEDFDRIEDIEDNEPDYPEDFDRIEEQNLRDEEEARQSAESEHIANQEAQAQMAEAEYQKLHKGCVSKQKVKDIIDRKRAWHKAECRSFKNCSVCMFLIELYNDFNIKEDDL